MIAGVTVTEIERKEDARGFLVEFLRMPEIGEKDGQIYCTVSAPGVVRGNHYHEHKFEWFTVIGGEGLLLLVDKKTGERQEIMLNESRPCVVRIPPGVVHALKNVGETPLYHVAYISKTFDPAEPDTVREVILE